MNRPAVADAADAADKAAFGRRSILVGRSLLWLAFLGPFFFLSYGFANRMAAQRVDVSSIHFGWERLMPFWPWTIIPYWSIDLFYGLAFLTCSTVRQVDCLGRRLLTAQLISVTFFLLVPVSFAFKRPPVEGLFGTLFAALDSVDQPFNQTPSLHISLLIIIWQRFASLRVAPAIRGCIHLWALLIGISVLTTWQHHFIGVPTGMAVGFFCLWLWPDEGRTTPSKRADDAGHFGLAARYQTGAVLALIVTLVLGRYGIVFGWLALALTLVAVNYAWAGAAGFQKQQGRHSLAAAWLFAPYTLAAKINVRLWTWRHPQPDRIADGVWLGRLPGSDADARAFIASPCTALFDLTAELPAPAFVQHYDALPSLDLTPLPARTLLAAARRIEALREQGEVLVACALGYSRSAAAVAAWLRWSGRAGSMDEALALLRERRPQVVLGPAWRQRLEEAECLMQEAPYGN
jgi:hypothetical protein